MARKKKQQEGEQIASEETPADLFESAEGSFAVGVDGMEPQSATEELAAEEIKVDAEPVAEIKAELPKSKAKVKDSAEQAETAPDAPVTVDGVANKLNEALEELGSDLKAQSAQVNPSLSYVLVKNPNSTYCFGRIPVESANPKPTMELLCNIPVKAHSDIAAAIKKINVPMSSRLFFHASGLL